MIRCKLFVFILFMTFISAAAAWADIEPVILQVDGCAFDYVDGTNAVVHIRVSNPANIAAACYTILYDTQSLKLTSITSDFFKSFDDQFAQVGASASSPGSVEVDGTSYTRPLVWQEKTTLPAGVMIAAVKIKPEEAQGDILMTLHFDLGEAIPGRYDIQIVPSVIKNSAAGYPGEGEAVAMVRGYEVREGFPLSLPEVAISAVKGGAVIYKDETPVRVSGQLTMEGVALGNTEVTLYSQRTNQSWVVTTDAEGRFETEVTSCAASMDLQMRFESPQFGTFSQPVAVADGGEMSVQFINTPPEAPVVSLASGQENTLTPTLTASVFADANHGHATSQWQIVNKAVFEARTSRAAGQTLVGDIDEEDLACLTFQAKTDAWLTTLEVPDSVLDAGTAYLARVRYMDNCTAKSGVSPWSECLAFTTVDSPDGFALEGGTLVPASQVLTDEEKAPFAKGAVCLKTSPDADTQSLCMGLELPDDGCLKMASAQPVKALGEKAVANLPDGVSLPYGVVGFSLNLDDTAPADGVIEVTVSFAEPLEEGAVWWKYNKATAEWMDYSEHAAFTPDRSAVVLELKDGGHGDFDGVKNGRIVDPGGAGIPKASPTPTPAPVDDDSSSSGGGCFIGTLGSSVAPSY